MHETIHQKGPQPSSRTLSAMMTLFKGTYSWDGTKTDTCDPISWFPGSCELIIIDFSLQNSGVSYLKPILCIFTQGSRGHSISVNPDKFARRICNDFSLDMGKVLWTEVIEPDEPSYEILSFKKSITVGEKTIYTVTRRPPIAGEMSLIEKGLALTVDPEQAERL